MIPYFVSLILLGIPLMWMEWAMGRFGGRHERVRPFRDIPTHVIHPGLTCQASSFRRRISPTMAGLALPLL